MTQHVTETPFITFWRAHNAKLFALGQPAATQGEAARAFKVWDDWHRRLLGAPVGYVPPCHQRNAGKSL